MTTDASQPSSMEVQLESFDCPQCQTTITRQHGSLICSECGFTPYHGAD